MMFEENTTTVVKNFIFVGLTRIPKMQIILFLIFFLIYVTTLIENLGIVALIGTSACLHTPMYFFLSSLSILDACFSSVFAPKMLVNFLADKNSISYTECAIQMYFFIGLGSAECFLLAAMAYDRYVAICKPLLYPVLMSPKVCILLVASSYVFGLFHSLIHTIFTFQLSFYGSVINHFFCDITALLSLSCSDTYINELLIFYVAGLVEITTILSVAISYVYILTNIVIGIHSATGRIKAFSTCTSHLTVVTIFHGAVLILHFQPKSSNRSPHQDMSDKILAVFCTIVIPLLNPLIYSLRNKEVKDALRSSWRRTWVKITRFFLFKKSNSFPNLEEPWFCS
ncbi:olfactory receptor 1019-like [Crotalus tigris]|uniref:olfactory receptor 1019-like n=1 Tax=Crotalus tigris TaxID=88082 RepID=UPI00192F2EC3|nr:olfactory receptor 1019-like [Crotalus tigris]